MSTIATICARGGSKGVPGKNIKPLLGKPLIVYTIEQALACHMVDDVYVSTDDKQIAAVALEAGAKVPGLRPSELASDSMPKLPVIEHLVGVIEAQGRTIDRVVDLDPTSPLREVSDIEACITLLDEEFDVVITGYVSEKNPYFNMVEDLGDGTVDLVKPGSRVMVRQQAPVVYAMNASIYVWHRRTLGKGLWGGRARIHVMPRERSIDIDDEFDFKLVEFLMQRRMSVELKDPDD